MARTALTQLQEQIEAIREEAYAAGYAAAMQSIRDFASQASAPAAAQAPAPRRAGRPAAAKPARRAPQRRQASASAKAQAPATRPQRGSNARMIEEILQAMAPQAARPTEIRSALRREKGVSMAFTSIRHALGQLEARRLVEQLPDDKSWRAVRPSGAAAGGPA